MQFFIINEQPFESTRSIRASAKAISGHFGEELPILKLDAKNALKKKNADDLKHFVFLAHTSDKATKYGGLTAVEFSKNFFDRFNESGADKKIVEDVYVIGCETGLMRQSKGTFLAQDIADELYKKGFTNVKVHAFKNIPGSDIVSSRVEIITKQGIAGKSVIGPKVGRVIAYSLTKEQEAIINKHDELSGKVDRKERLGDTDSSERQKLINQSKEIKEKQKFAKTYEIREDLDRIHNIFIPEGAADYNRVPLEKNWVQEQIIIELEKFIIIEKKLKRKNELKTLLDGLRNLVIDPAHPEKIKEFIEKDKCKSTNNKNIVNNLIKKYFNGNSKIKDKKQENKKRPKRGLRLKKKKHRSRRKTNTRTPLLPLNQDSIQSDDVLSELSEVDKKLLILEKYSETVNKNQKGNRHAYSCCFFTYDMSVDGKDKQIQNLVADIKGCTSTEDIQKLKDMRTLINTLLSGKLTSTIRDDKNINFREKRNYDYKTLNQGQNITTRLLGLETTTGKYIRELGEAIDKEIKGDQDDSNTGYFCC